MNAEGGAAGGPEAPAVPAGIAREIATAGGRVTFARFMELALTHPTEGYYSRAGASIGPLLGRRGHFTTAPHRSPAFRRAVVRLLTDLVDASLAAASPSARVAGTAAGGCPSVAVIELGGGEGDLARAVLKEWHKTRPDLQHQVVYSIVEIGEGLRERQRVAVAGMIAQGWSVRWAADLGGAAAGTRPVVIVGNEFVDALPVHLVDLRSPRPLEAWVGASQDGSGRLDELWDDITEEATAELRLLFGATNHDRLQGRSRDGIVELRPAVGPLMLQAAAVMPEGCLLTIDYGGWLPGGEADEDLWSGPSAGALHGRTVRGYFRHQMVADPYLRIGRQDLTADVDFRALELHGRKTGFETVLYTSVATLLMGDGGEDELRRLLKRAGASLEADREATVLEALLDEEGLGGTFKVMLQVRE